MLHDFLITFESTLVVMVGLCFAGVAVGWAISAIKNRRMRKFLEEDE